MELFNNNNRLLDSKFQTGAPLLNETNIELPTMDFEHYGTERVIYLIVTALFTLFSIFAIGLLIYLRNWYIVRQRNFILTLFGGITSFIYGFSNLITQCFNTSCGEMLFITNIIGPLSYLIFISRSVRLIMLYKLNIYKVTTIKKGRMKGTNYGDKEPNMYLNKIYQKVNKIILGIIIIPTLITIPVSIYFQRRSEFCFLNDYQDASSILGKYQMNHKGPLKEFMIMQIFGNGLIILCIVLLYLMKDIQDSYKYGIKFDCLSTAIVCIIAQCLALLMNLLKSKFGTENEFINKFALYFKQGKVFYFIISAYMIFASIILPIYLCYRSSYEKNKYFNEPTHSLQYFYKILNSPSLIEELRTISIKEFSVENVLFWENYQVLQKMVYKYQIELRQAEILGNPQLIEQYNFEAYYQSQLQAYSVSSMEEYSYDPNMIVPEKLMPYYISFYHTFIDVSGPASVNISGRISRQIYNEFCTYPTIGIFDEAKNEIVEIMYSSVFPILLKQNRKEFNKI